MVTDWCSARDTAGHAVVCPPVLTGTKPIPNSSQVVEYAVSFGVSCVHTEYSLCTAADGLNGVRAADGACARPGESEVLHFSLADELPDRAGHVLDRHGRVDPVLVIEVDAVGS